jgi:hypothetical protein
LRLRILWVTAIFPAGVWAGSIFLPGNDSLLTFSSNQFSIASCGSPCSVDGSSTPIPSNPAYMITWIFQFSNPISYTTNPSGNTGDFMLGAVANFTLSDDDGGSVVADALDSPVPSWTSSPTDGTVLNFDIQVSSSSIPGDDPLANLMDTALGADPQVGQTMAVQFDVSCTNDSALVQCMGVPPDPSGSITSGAITGDAQPQAPEPATFLLLAGGIAGIAVKRRITSCSK